MTRFLLIPGMHHGGWWFDPLVERLEALGHTALAFTPSGLEPDPAPRPDRRITLATHVADVVRAIDVLDAGSGRREVVVVAHSLGGLLATAVADARPSLVRCLVYLDAFYPEDGDSAFSITNDAERAWFVDDLREAGDEVAPLPFFDPRTRPHPAGTLFQALRLTGAWRQVPHRVYAEALEWPDGDTPMAASLARVHADPDVEYVAWQTRHNVMHDGPQRVLDLIADR